MKGLTVEIAAGATVNAGTVSTLRVGKYEVEVGTAWAWVSAYVARGSKVRYGFPAYDLLDLHNARGDLTEAELMAPALLNAPPSLTAFYWLLDQRAKLNKALGEIDEDADLLSEDWERQPLADLFRLLDSADGVGVALTTFSKVLHRKRPHLIPLWDKYVCACYSDGDLARVPKVSGRSYGEYVIEIARAMRADLTKDGADEIWDELADMATPRISPLRALDIVA